MERSGERSLPSTLARRRSISWPPMSRLSKIASLVLVAGVLAQIGLAQEPFVHRRTPGLPPTVPLPTVSTSASDFIRDHVPPGEAIVEVTPTHDNATLYYYFLLSAALVPRNSVWWAVPAPATHVTDWWHDVSAGPDAIRRLALAVHARYVVFAGEEVPQALRVSRISRMNSALAVVELAPARQRTSPSAA
jgi:hypothetical protein